jgi:hypothetical protein
MATKEELARQLTDMAQRVSMQIAELPLESRERAYETCEEEVRALAEELWQERNDREELVQEWMKALRKMVLDLDVSGQPKGGTA